MPGLHVRETIEKLTQINQSSVSRMAHPPLKILCHMEKVPPIDNSNDVFSFLVIKSKSQIIYRRVLVKLELDLKRNIFYLKVSKFNSIYKNNALKYLKVILNLFHPRARTVVEI